MKSILIILTTLFICYTAAAQSVSDFKSTDSTTLVQFQNKDWAGLVKTGETAIRNGSDYYYLRYRLGVAWYEKGNFFKSAKHFEKARQWNSGDPTLLEYLYFSYLFSGREDDALALASHFGESLLKKLNIKLHQPLKSVYLEAGTKISSEQDSVKYMIFGTLGLRHRLGPKTQIYHAGAFINQDYLGMDFNQYEYYLRFQYRISKAISLIPAGHVNFLRSDTYTSFGSGNSPFFEENQIREKAWIAHLGMRYRAGRLSLTPSLGYAQQKTNTISNSRLPAQEPPGSITRRSETWNNAESFQTGLSIGYIPRVFQNRFSLDIYSGLQISEGEKHFIGRFLAAYRFNRFLTLSASYFKANTSLYGEDQALVFNNSFSPTVDRISATAILSPFEGMTLFLAYQNERKKEQYFNFRYHTVFLGLNFKL